MSGNPNPIYTRVGSIQWVVLSAANTAKDGTGVVGVVFIADTTNGGFVRAIRCKPLGTNVASVVRVFVNNGQPNSTPANNSYFDDLSLPITTLTEVAGQITLDIPINTALDPTFQLLLTLGTAVSAGWAFTAVGGKY